MAPTQQGGTTLLQDLAKHEEACILSWLDVFGYQDLTTSMSASIHLDRCLRCQDGIKKAERELRITVGKAKGWLTRAAVIAKRHGPLKRADRKKILDGLAHRIALASRPARPSERRA